MSPAAKIRPGSLPPSETLHLSDLISSEWEGFYFNNCRLFLPGYRGAGYTAGDLRAQFWHLQQIELFRRESDLARRELSAAIDRADAAEARADYYRRQLRLESRMGMMLSAFSTT